ncbi:Ubiquinone/menaquinone biosynthesis C-methyltransferase UbiE [bioreactor metagenome]|uniref:Ubiquinone/menaquinone biosynthesis C-methyltransferase UbiE n=1 Tax=bioreactor metagenome TaxID=1076179 RepID=A0A644V8Z4_9ZZZZ|nr:methyltransferase domain-containing protein [Candidatus Elulimicrobiales bacterium]
MFLSPVQIIEDLNLKRGDTVADFGCGAGAYVFEASKKVGDDGKVYAIDLDENILDKINREAEKMNIVNIDTILSDVESKVQIESMSCDLIILSNVLSEVDNLDNVLEEVKRTLRPDGRILIVDWKKGDNALSRLRPNLVDEEKIVAVLAKHDFSVKKHLPAGEYHYAFLAGR